MSRDSCSQKGIDLDKGQELEHFSNGPEKELEVGDGEARASPTLASLSSSLVSLVWQIGVGKGEPITVSQRTAVALSPPTELRPLFILGHTPPGLWLER